LTTTTFPSPSAVGTDPSALQTVTTSTVLSDFIPGPGDTVAESELGANLEESETPLDQAPVGRTAVESGAEAQASENGPNESEQGADAPGGSPESAAPGNITTLGEPNSSEGAQAPSDTTGSNALAPTDSPPQSSDNNTNRTNGTNGTNQSQNDTKNPNAGLPPQPLDPSDPRANVASILPIAGPYWVTDMGAELGTGQINRASLVRSISAPREVDNTLKLLLFNGLLALLLMLLVALPAEIFNATFKTHHDEVVRHVDKFHQRLRPIDEFIDRIPNWASLSVFAVAAAGLWAFIDPSFGTNKSSLALVLGLTGAIATVTFVSTLTKNGFLKKSYGIHGSLRVLPAGVVLAAVLLLISKLAHFNPGYLFGVFASLGFVKHPTAQQSGRAVARAAGWMLLVAVISWFAWVPVKEMAIAGKGGLGVLIVDAFLSNLWVWSLQALVFSLIPLDYLDGKDVMAWSKKAWVGIYGLVMFIFVHTVMHPKTARYGANPNANIRSMSYLFVGFMTAAVAFWAYFQGRKLWRARTA
jgi:hypothetical protein